jgi:hypothetical protein
MTLAIGSKIGNFTMAAMTQGGQALLVCETCGRERWASLWAVRHGRMPRCKCEFTQPQPLEVSPPISENAPKPVVKTIIVPARGREG